MKPITPYLLLTIFTLSCVTKEPLSPRFNHIFVQVSNIERSVEFYTKAFDLEVTNSLDTLIVTEKDGQPRVYLRNIVFLKFPNQDFVFELRETTETDTLSNFDLFEHIGVDVNDIDAAVQKVISAGAELVVPVRLIETNNLILKHAYLKGPDGELIELDEIISGEF